MLRILLIDNYDSFTYNLYHYLEELNGGEVTVMRNDEIDFQQINSFDKVLISPGPGLPKDAGSLMEFLKNYSHQKSILGVCLGQQAIAEHFGMKLQNLNAVVHGQSRRINVLKKEAILFRGLPKNFKVGRYHSWVVEKANFSDEFEVTSEDEQGNIMSIQHKELPIHAVQFHPESVLTEFGKEMIQNWLNS